MRTISCKAVQGLCRFQGVVILPAIPEILTSKVRKTYISFINSWSFLMLQRNKEYWNP